MLNKKGPPSREESVDEIENGSLTPKKERAPKVS